MAHPTTIRLSDELLERVDQRSRRLGVDRAAYLRDLVSAALARDEEEEVMGDYRQGKVTLTAASKRLGLDPWAFLDLLRRRGESLNVELEDWMNSASRSY